MLRAARDAGTPDGLAAAAAMASGSLVADEIVIGCVRGDLLVCVCVYDAAC